MNKNENQLNDFEPQLDEATVKEYIRKIESGEQLTAPVLLMNEDGRYSIVDGRHRVEALKRCGVDAISGCYIVTLPPEKVGQLRSALNQRHQNSLR